jgi:hypothetical protein
MSVRGAVAGVVAITGVAAFWTLSEAREQRPLWNERASSELTAALHQMHEAWGSGDIAGLKQLVIGDDALVTFELDPVTHKPIRLGSKQELDGFVDAIVKDQKDMKSVYRLEHPVVNCKASDAMGICTEECTVHVTTPDGVEQVHRLWSTATAVKQDGTWKWVQWHMSLAAPRQTFKNGKPVSGQE